MVVGVAEVSLLRQAVVVDGGTGTTPSTLWSATWQQQQQQQERRISLPSTSFSSKAASVGHFARSGGIIGDGSPHLISAASAGSVAAVAVDGSSTLEGRDFKRAAAKKNPEGVIYSFGAKSRLKHNNSQFESATTRPWGVDVASRPTSLISWPLQAAVAETAGEGLKWWERGTAPNMLDVFSTQQFVDALQAAGDRLVIVEFFASWCPSCRALFPKFCKIAADYDDIIFLKVNIDDNRQMCKSLNVKVLPFFHIYRGASGRLDTFSCSLSKLQRLRDAITKHHDGPREDSDPPEVIPEVLSSLLAKREDDQSAPAAAE